MAALLAVVSCAKKEDPAPSGSGNPEAPAFEVSFEDSNILTEDGIKLTWTEGDLVSCFFNSGGNALYKFEGETGSDSGVIKVVDYPEGTLLDTFYAAYPYSEDNALADGVLKLSLPTEQTYAEDSFSANSNTMVAATTAEELSYAFSNVCGYVRLKVYGEAAIKSIEFMGNNDEIIAGAADVNPATKSLDITGGETIITLNCGEGVTLGEIEAEATEFWLVVPPTAFEVGFTVTLTDTEGKSMEKTFDTPLTVERNKVCDCTIEYDVTPVGADPDILFEAKFKADGSAKNIGTMSDLIIEAKKGTTITTAKRGNSYVAVFGNITTLKDNEVHTDGFYYVDYSANTKFKEHLADGFTMEVLCKPYNYRGNFWSTPFSLSTCRVHHNQIENNNKVTWSLVASAAENKWDDDGIFNGWYWGNFSPITVNAYQHVVLTYDGVNSWDMIVNGQKNGPWVNSTALRPGNALAIGGIAYTGGRAAHLFCGEVAIARIYDSAKSVNEVVARYNELKPTIDVLNTAEAPTSNAKKVSIIGDSYSTFSMYSNVDISGQFNGYSCMYPYAHITDVNVVTDTWWGKLCSTDEFQLEVNNSYGGSTICNLSYGNNDVSNTDLSFIHRVGTNRNGVDTMGNPDIILIFGGTNDSWANARMGKFIFSDWSYYDLMSFRGGFAKLITKLKERYPNAKIYNICNVCKYDGRPGITKRAAESMAYICKHYDVPNIQLDLTKAYPDMRPEKPGEDHPVEAGMQHIFEQVYAVLTGKAEPTPAPEEKPMDSHPALDGEPIQYSIKQNLFIEYKTGKEVSLPKDKTWIVTDYITIPESATHISVNPITIFDGGAGGNQTTPIAFYDADKNYLKEKSVAPNGSCATEILNLPIPEEAAYVRFSWTDTPYAHKKTNEMVETYGVLNAVWHLN